MQLSERLRLESSTLRLGLFTLLGIVIELVLALPVMSLAITLVAVPAPVVASNQATIFYSSALYPFIALYILAPIVYCIFASFLLRPRRIVSPLNIQLGTVAVGGIIVLEKVLFSTAYFTPVPTSQHVFIAITFGIQFFLAGAMTVVLGFLQTIVVRWWVGFNLEDLDRASYIINDSLKFVEDQFDDSLRETFGLSKRAENGMVIMTSQAAGGESVVMVLRETRDSKKVNCLLATVAYHNRLTVLTKTEQASALRDAMVWALRGRCAEHVSSIIFTRVEALDDPASTRAYDLARTRTESKPGIGVQFFSKLPKEYRYGIIATVGSWFLLAFLWLLQAVSVDTLVGTTVFVIIALFVEIGIALREEVNR